MGTVPGLAFVEMYQTARAKVEDSLGYASSQRAHAKTIDIPVPTPTSVDLFFGNRVAISEDGNRLGVQSLRKGRVCVEISLATTPLSPSSSRSACLSPGPLVLTMIAVSP